MYLFYIKITDKIKLNEQQVTEILEKNYQNLSTTQEWP